ncbi:DUF4097 domain-containing protein [candidate division KSB1 bacterium]
MSSYKRAGSGLIFGLFLIFLSTASTFAQGNRTDVFVLEDRLSKTYPLKAGGFFYLENVVGDIRVKTWNRNEVKIDVDLRGRSREDIEIEIYHTENEIEVSTNYENDDYFQNQNRRRHSVEYTVSIPKNTRTELKGTTSTIKIEDLNNKLTAVTITGDLDVKNITGNVDLRTTTGRAYISNITGDIECTVVTGDIEILNSKFTYLDVVNTTGDIEVEAQDVDPRSKYNLKTVTGDIDLYLPKNVKADINASVPTKNFHSDFKLESRSGKYDKKEEDRIEERRDRRRRDRDFNFDIKIDIDLDFLPKKIEGQINGGGARIYLSTFNGDIELRSF